MLSGFGSYGDGNDDRLTCDVCLCEGFGFAVDLGNVLSDSDLPSNHFRMIHTSAHNIAHLLRSGALPS